MLVLDRDIGEWIVIKFGDKVARVKVSEVHGNKQVRFAIEAPKDIVVYREELKDFKPRQKVESFE